MDWIFQLKERFSDYKQQTQSCFAYKRHTLHEKAEDKRMDKGMLCKY